MISVGKKTADEAQVLSLIMVDVPAGGMQLQYLLYMHGYMHLYAAIVEKRSKRLLETLIHSLHQLW